MNDARDRARKLAAEIRDSYYCGRAPDESNYREEDDALFRACFHALNEIAAPIAQRRAATQPPRIVCLCGSTRFKNIFLEMQRRETLAGRIVLSVGWFGHVDGDVTDEQKQQLDELHLQKIDLADEILVINPDGYVGKSTTNEIERALLRQKRVRSLTPLPLRFHELAKEYGSTDLISPSGE